MNEQSGDFFPLVSVIIPCYNQAHFLPKALASVQQQTYPAVEIVLVDDGSQDDTRRVAQAHQPPVRYVYQANQGLSAARNTGVRHSTGAYLLFLDADDWLYPQALALNVPYLRDHPRAAFVSGAFTRVFVQEGQLHYEQRPLSANHYRHLLHGNYIGMIAAVLFQRWVFDTLWYDETLVNCEDYDLYLRVARQHPVLHHTGLVAAYRLHSANMSANIPAMLNGILKVRNAQKQYLNSPEEIKAFEQGDIFIKEYYAKDSLKSLLADPELAVESNKQNKPIFTSLSLMNSKKSIKRYGAAVIRLFKKPEVPRVGKIDFGSFSSVKPFSNSFGYDRGGPIDRYYIENFLRDQSHCITGRVLEIGDNSYTKQFGREQVTKSEVFHADSTNTDASYTGDISNAPQIPDALFDCIILTQTLQFIYDFKAALATCHRILKPGGVLLLTAPGISPLTDATWNDLWYWSFTNKALQKIMQETFPTAEVEVTSFGNVFSAAAFVYGVGLPEVDTNKLDYVDYSYQVINAVKAVKK